MNDEHPAPADAGSLYNLERWAEGYVRVAPHGHLAVHPANDARAVDLVELAATLQRRGLRLPVLLRFTDILRHRVRRLHDAFDLAAAAHAYPGGYTPVYPIKVNQHQSVVAALLDGGRPVGLESGSKPELLAVLGMAPAAAVPIICNGYKDREYVRLALIGRRMGCNVILVVEKLAELQIILHESALMGVRPSIGMRIRLATIGAGKWQNSGGKRAKFGLNAADALRMLQTLERDGLADRLELMHFHLGSQIPNLADIRRGLAEAARWFADLHRRGFALRYADVGGGLGIDYQGNASTEYCSMNYSPEAYADAVIGAFAEACRAGSLPPPQILTESGRAMTGHHAALLMDVAGVERVANGGDPAPGTPDPAGFEALIASLNSDNAAAVYAEATRLLDASEAAFVRAELGLEGRAASESHFNRICARVREVTADAALRDELDRLLADRIFCNFSLFQSLPDAWAFDQVFPVLPIQRLHEVPRRHGVIMDLTCDSDGQLHHYANGPTLKSTLAIHAIEPGERYILGVFLLGAYQEILGDVHNLFGDTHAVNVRLDADGSVLIEETHQGDNAGEVLNDVHYHHDDLLNRYSARLAQSDLETRVLDESIAELKQALYGYTYLGG